MDEIEYGAGTLAACLIDIHENKPIEYKFVKQTYEMYLQTDEWKNKANAARERAGNRCQLCNSTGFLHVHHRHYNNIFNEQDDDLIVLCSACHAKFHNKERQECSMLNELRVRLTY